MIKIKKKFYQSKSVWAGIIIAAVGIFKALGIDIPTELIITLAGALGIVGIRTAIDQK